MLGHLSWGELDIEMIQENEHVDETRCGHDMTYSTDLHTPELVEKHTNLFCSQSLCNRFPDKHKMMGVRDHSNVQRPCHMKSRPDTAPNGRETKLIKVALKVYSTYRSQMRCCKL